MHWGWGSEMADFKILIIALTHIKSGKFPKGRISFSLYLAIPFLQEELVFLN